MSRMKLARAVLAPALALCFGALHAAPVVFQGGDPGSIQGGPTPNSDLVANNFDVAAASLGTLNKIDFESLALGSFSSLEIAPGVTASGLGYSGAATHSIMAGDRCGNVCGFNTTFGGRKWLDVDANFITLTFATPIEAFGAYITGLQLAGETVVFSDGSMQTLTISNNGSGAQFFGFTDAGKLISSIVIDTRNPSNSLGDFIGLDDIRYVSAGNMTVPEPATIALLGIALVGLGAARRRRQ